MNGLQDLTDSYAPFMTLGFDFSMGVAGTVVPEPVVGLWLIAGATLFAWKRRRPRVNLTGIAIINPVKAGARPNA